MSDTDIGTLHVSSFLHHAAPMRYHRHHHLTGEEAGPMKVGRFV